MTKCQEQSRWICRAFGLPSCQQVSQRILTQPLPEQTGQLAAACSLTLRESHNISCATVVLSSKLVPMVMLKKKAKMMAETEVGPNAVQGRMWGWEGSEVRGRGYFISPPQLPHPLHQQQYTGTALAGAVSLQEEEAQGPGAWLPPCFALAMAAVIVTHQNACSRQKSQIYSDQCLKTWLLWTKASQN